MDMAPFVPTPSFLTTRSIVRREKRRQRKAQEESHKDRVVRKGFVFNVDPSAKSCEPLTTSTSSNTVLPPTTTNRSSVSTNASQTFVFRVKKGKPSSTPVDPVSVSEALVLKKERAAKHLERRKRLERRKAMMEVDEKREEEIQTLNMDQQLLCHVVHEQVKREIRKTKKEFAKSAAQQDILQLTQVSLQALQTSLITFLKQHQPCSTMITTVNPENARLTALIQSYEMKIRSLSEEEAQWKSIHQSLEVDATSVMAEKEAPSLENVERSCDLTLARELTHLQLAALAQVETSAQRLQVIEDSMKSVDRLVLQAELSKAKLFDAFHNSAFQGYTLCDPKETMRALFKLVPSTTM